MGKGSAPAAPAAPNPVDTARASTSTNVATAITNAFLNNTNQITPDGSLRYDQTDTYNWTDPYTGTNIAIPQFTATTDAVAAAAGDPGSDQRRQVELGRHGQHAKRSLGQLAGQARSTLAARRRRAIPTALPMSRRRQRRSAMSASNSRRLAMPATSPRATAPATSPPIGSTSKTR